MKKSYAESTFYGDLEKLIRRKLNGELDDKEYNEEYKKLVEKELPDDEWLQNHFNSTSEYLVELENVEEVDNLESLIEIAYFEIDVMKRCGQTRQADLMKKWLEEAINK